MNNLTSPQDFILAGNSTFTIQSKKSGSHFTYAVKRDKVDLRHYVSVMITHNNYSFFKFIGTIFNERAYYHGKKSTVSKDAPSVIAFKWSWQHILSNDLNQMEIWHMGYCGRCGKKLTNPESIQNGIGPICMEKM